jgi:cardiolipin synthase
MKRRRGRRWITASLAVLATLAGIVLVANLTSTERKIEHQIPHVAATGDGDFRRAMGNLLGPPLVGGNRVTVLRNGDEIFPSMLEAIRGAKETITFENYIYWSGQVGHEFSVALAERARNGVRVHVLLDWVGAGKMDAADLERMEKAGVQVEKYHPLRWYALSRLNHRTHRRLLVVDGRVGFTGGAGIGDEWLGNAQDPDHWRESHFRVEGPVAAQMQAAFMDNWMKTHAEVLVGEDYFPPLSRSGEMTAQLFKSSSREGSESVRLMYLLSIASARRNIRLAASYFVPDDLAVAAFVEARRRGVAIEIVLPGDRVDAELTRRASRSRWGGLLQAGVEIYEYQPTMYHCKVMVVDDAWISVGSTNFDDRSFRLNDEANLNVLDRGLAAALTSDFESDKAKSRKITYAEWRHRPWREKLVEFAAGLFRSQL